MSEKVTKFILVRHGETDWNKNGRWQGYSDVPLNDLGVRQAEAVAAYLAQEKIDTIYSSQLVRASDTAMRIAVKHSLGVEKDSRLSEIGFGDWEGLTESEIDARHGIGTHSKFMADRINQCPPGGETVDELFARVEQSIRAIYSGNLNKTVLIVSHGGAIRAALSVVLGGGKNSWQRMELGNCSVSKILWRDNRVPVVRVLGDTHFLER